MTDVMIGTALPAQQSTGNAGTGSLTNDDDPPLSIPNGESLKAVAPNGIAHSPAAAEGEERSVAPSPVQSESETREATTTTSAHMETDDAERATENLLTNGHDSATPDIAVDGDMANIGIDDHKRISSADGDAVQPVVVVTNGIKRSQEQQISSADEAVGGNEDTRSEYVVVNGAKRRRCSVDETKDSKRLKDSDGGPKEESAKLVADDGIRLVAASNESESDNTKNGVDGAERIESEFGIQAKENGAMEQFEISKNAAEDTVDPAVADGDDTENSQLKLLIEDEDEDRVSSMVLQISSESEEVDNADVEKVYEKSCKKEHVDADEVSELDGEEKIIEETVKVSESEGKNKKELKVVKEEAIPENVGENPISDVDVADKQINEAQADVTHSGESQSATDVQMDVQAKIPRNEVKFESDSETCATETEQRTKVDGTFPANSKPIKTEASNQNNTSSADLGLSKSSGTFKNLSQLKNSFKEFTREDLESLIMTKMLEAIVFKSSAAETAQLISAQSQQIALLREKLVECQSQFKMMEDLFKRTSEEVKMHQRKGCKVTPKPAHRTVAIQFGTRSQFNCKNCGVTSFVAPANADNSEQAESTPLSAQLRQVAPKTLASPAKVPQPASSVQARTPPKTAAVTVPQSKPLKTTRTRVQPPQTDKVVTATSGPSTAAAPVEQLFVDLTEDDDVATTPVPQAATVQRTSAAATQVPKRVDRPGPASKSQPPPLRTTLPAPLNPIQKRASLDSAAAQKKLMHPAPLPSYLTNIPHNSNKYPKAAPPVPKVMVRRSNGGIILTWTIENFVPSRHAEVRDYQLYGYKMGDDPPVSSNWSSLGHVKAMKLPMAVTLTQFQPGQRYFFCVRARDSYGRYGAFSVAVTW